MKMGSDFGRRYCGLILIIYVLGFGVPAGAEGYWNADVLEWANQYSQNPDVTNPMKEGFLAAGWGALRARKLFHWGAHKRFSRTMSNVRFTEGKLKVLFRAHHGRAPLIVFSPGIFNSYKDAMSMRGLRNFYSRGYHVLVIPNPWSSEYIHARPQFLPGDLENEARVVLDLARTAKEELGDRVTSVHLVGESYGAGLSIIASALDADSPQPIIDGDVTAFSPPIDVRVSMRIMDTHLDEMQEYFQSHCRKFYLFAALNVMKAKSWKDLKKRTVECGPAMVAFVGFQNLLTLTAKTLLKEGRVDGANLKDQISPRKKIDLRFTRFFSEFVPENNDFVIRGSGDIVDWFLLAHERGFDRIRILSTRDDFLNDSAQWSELVDFQDKNLIVLPWGGHLGYLAQPGFQNFLDLAFGDAKVQFDQPDSVLE